MPPALFSGLCALSGRAAQILLRPTWFLGRRLDPPGRLSFCPNYRLLGAGAWAVGPIERRKPHVLVPADDAALRAPVLDPILLGLQRQFSQERAGLPAGVQNRRSESRSSDATRGCGLHRALFFSFRARRGDGRPLRQGTRCATPQACGNRNRFHCSLWLLAAFARLRNALDCDPLRRAVPVRGDRIAIRADQIRHPSGPSRSFRAPRRQCARGRRDLHRHPARIDRRRHGRQGRRRPVLVRADDDHVLAAVLGLEPVHPADRRGGARPGDPGKPRALDLRPAAAAARGPAHPVGRVGDQLVLAGGRGGGRTAGAAGQECARRHRGGRADLPRDLLDLDRGRRRAGGVAGGRAHHPAADLDRGGAARIVLDRPRMVDVGRRADPRPDRLLVAVHDCPRPAHRDRSRRHRGRRRAVHRADFRGGAGLGRRRPARAGGGGRQRAQRRLHRGRHRPGRAAAVGHRDRDAGRLRHPRTVQSCGSGAYRENHAGERAQRCAVDHLSHAVPHPGEGPRQPDQGRAQRHHRAQPRELPRRRPGAVAARPQAGVRHRYRHRQAVVGAAVREADQCDAARPAEADGGAHLDRRGQGRQRADHLSGGTHHSHRQPDEGL